MTTKIHLAADQDCRPMARVVTAGQRHDAVAFTAAMADLKILRSGGTPCRTRPDRVLADKAYSSQWAAAVSSRLDSPTVYRKSATFSTQKQRSTRGALNIVTSNPYTPEELPERIGPVSEAWLRTAAGGGALSGRE